MACKHFHRVAGEPRPLVRLLRYCTEIFNVLYYWLLSSVIPVPPTFMFPQLLCSPIASHSVSVPKQKLSDLGSEEGDVAGCSHQPRGT